MKMMSRTEGSRKRKTDGLGCAGVIKVYKVSKLQSFKVSKFQKESVKAGDPNCDVSLQLGHLAALKRGLHQNIPSEQPSCESVY
jgi:hypothetical protein